MVDNISTSKPSSLPQSISISSVMELNAAQLDQTASLIISFPSKYPSLGAPSYTIRGSGVSLRIIIRFKKSWMCKIFFSLQCVLFKMIESHNFICCVMLFGVVLCCVM